MGCGASKQQAAAIEAFKAQAAAMAPETYTAEAAAEAAAMAPPAELTAVQVKAAGPMAFLSGEYRRAPDDERAEEGDFYFGPPEFSTVFYLELPDDDPDHVTEGEDGYVTHMIMLYAHGKKWLLFSDDRGVSGNEPYFLSKNGSPDGWQGPWESGPNSKGAELPVLSCNPLERPAPPRRAKSSKSTSSSTVLDANGAAMLGVVAS